MYILYDFYVIDVNSAPKEARRSKSGHKQWLKIVIVIMT